MTWPRTLDDIEPIAPEILICLKQNCMGVAARLSQIKGTVNN